MSFQYVILYTCYPFWTYRNICDRNNNPHPHPKTHRLLPIWLHTISMETSCHFRHQHLPSKPCAIRGSKFPCHLRLPILPGKTDRPAFKASGASSAVRRRGRDTSDSRTRCGMDDQKKHSGTHSGVEQPHGGGRSCGKTSLAVTLDCGKEEKACIFLHVLGYQPTRMKDHGDLERRCSAFLTTKSNTWRRTPA